MSVKKIQLAQLMSTPFQVRFTYSGEFSNTTFQFDSLTHVSFRSHLGKITDQAVFIQQLTLPKPTGYAYFGSSVSISSGLIAVGAPGVSLIPAEQ